MKFKVAWHGFWEISQSAKSHAQKRHFAPVNAQPSPEFAADKHEQSLLARLKFVQLRLQRFCRKWKEDERKAFRTALGCDYWHFLRASYVGDMIPCELPCVELPRGIYELRWETNDAAQWSVIGWLPVATRIVVVESKVEPENKAGPNSFNNFICECQ